MPWAGWDQIDGEAVPRARFRPPLVYIQSRALCLPPVLALRPGTMLESRTDSSASTLCFVHHLHSPKGSLVLGPSGLSVHLPQRRCLGRGRARMNKGWPLAQPRSHLLLPPVWQHDTKAVWLVYTFQAESLFRGRCSLCNGPPTDKASKFLN